MLSCRVVKVAGEKPNRAALKQSEERAIYATWHQRMSYLFHPFGSQHATVMISQSRDGEYAARVAKWLGFRTVRGSATRGGFRALKGLTQKIKEGEIGGMLADGPLGPARVAKIGSVVLARDAGALIVPILWGADRCWTLNTWDRYLIPKPFARVAMCYPEPIRVPRSATGEELEHYRCLFEERMNEAARWCDEQFGPERPWRKVTQKCVPEVGPIDSPPGGSYGKGEIT
jgi:lysophospholipid acyltransferase (LPLAT)-like uncharacterized protein